MKSEATTHRQDTKKQHRSPLAYVEEAPCVAELRYLAVRRTFGWRGAAAAYAKSAGGFLNSAAKSAEKLGLASGKAGKQLGYALHRTLSAEWLLRERDVIGLPQGLPELLDGVAPKVSEVDRSGPRSPRDREVSPTVSLRSQRVLAGV